MAVAWIGSAAFAGVAVLYILLVLGFPYGELAMGGKHKVMPKSMRLACAVSVLVQLLAAAVLMQTGGIISTALSDGLARGLCYFLAVYLTLNTVMNGISRSKKEKYAMTPLSLLTAVCFWITALNG
jgi:hypothetical protein